MAVGKVLAESLMLARLGRRGRVTNRPNQGPLVELGLGAVTMTVRTADIILMTLLKPESANKYLQDIIEARNSQDSAAIARLKEYEKEIQLPGEGEVIPKDLPWKIVSQICGLDIAHLLAKDLTIDGRKIRITDPRPNSFTFNIEVDAVTQSFLAFKFESIPTKTALTARINREGIVLSNPEGGSHLYDPNNEKVSGTWVYSYMEPIGHSSFGETDYQRSNAECTVKDLNLRQIVLGLLKDIVDNGYLLGSAGK